MKKKLTVIFAAVFLPVVLLVFFITAFIISPDSSAKDETVASRPSDKDSPDMISESYEKAASDSTRSYIYDKSESTKTGENAAETADSRKFMTSFEEKTASSLAHSDGVMKEEDVSVNEPGIIQSAYSDIGIYIASTYVNIRDKASTGGRIRGKLYRDAAAKILDTVGDWYYIESGNVRGYIKSDYIKTGIPEDELIEKYGILRISVISEGLNVRKSPEIESEKVAVIYRNECYPAIGLMDGWVKIEIPDEKITGYVSREYVELLVDFKKAISIEEEEELKKREEIEKAKKESGIKYREAFKYTEEDLKLLACLVHAEAGNQSYEGKLAVANVVLNRVKSGKFPNTIKEVIYQPGQFTVAANGALAKQLKKYKNYTSKSHLSSIKAAKAALSGENNIGSRLYFNEYKASVKMGYDKKKNCVKIDDQLFW